MFRPGFLFRVFAKFLKFQTFFRQKWDKICYFSPLALFLLEVDTLKLRAYSSKPQKELVVFPLALKVFWDYKMPVCCNFKLDSYTKCTIYL